MNQRSEEKRERMIRQTEAFLNRHLHPEGRPLRHLDDVRRDSPSRRSANPPKSGRGESEPSQSKPVFRDLVGAVLSVLG